MPEVKPDLMVCSSRGSLSDRALVGRTMPFFLEGACLPRADHIDGVNILAGVCKRFAADSPPPPAYDPSLFQSLHSTRNLGRLLSRRRFLRLLTRFTNLLIRQFDRCGLLHPLDSIPSFEEWLEMVDRPQAWKDDIREAMEWPADHKGRTEYTNPFCRAYSPGARGGIYRTSLGIVKTHVKDEPYDDLKYLRLINARVDYSKAYMGPVFKAMEKIVCRLPWFAKYVPDEERSSIILGLISSSPNYVITDYSSFEAHFVPAIMAAMERPLYRYMLSRGPAEDGTQFLRFWEKFVRGANTLDVCKQFKVQLRGTRMSGEMNTSLANGWCNLVLMMFGMWDKGATWDELLSLKGYVEGDDGVFDIPKRICPTTEQMALYGFRLKMMTTTDVCEASFCGQIFDPVTAVLVADPFKMLLKLGWVGRTHLNVNAATMRELLLAKALSYAYRYNGCPIISPACFHIIRVMRALGTKATTKIERMTSDEHARRQFETARKAYDAGKLVEQRPPPSTRYLIQRLYGLEVADQYKVERECVQWSYGRGGVHIPVDMFPPAWVKTWDRYVEDPTPPDLSSRRSFWDRLRVHCGQFGVRLPDYSKMCRTHPRRYLSL